MAYEDGCCSAEFVGLKRIGSERRADGLGDTDKSWQRVREPYQAIPFLRRNGTFWDGALNTENPHIRPKRNPYAGHHCKP